MSARFLVTPLAQVMGLDQADTLAALGVGARTASEYRLCGIPLATATRMADTLELDPAEIWTDWHETIAEANADRRRRYTINPPLRQPAQAR